MSLARGPRLSGLRSRVALVRLPVRVPVSLLALDLQVAFRVQVAKTLRSCGLKKVSRAFCRNDTGYSKGLDWQNAHMQRAHAHVPRDHHRGSPVASPGHSLDTYTCIHIYAHTHIYIYLCTCAYVYKHLYLHLSTYIYIDMCVYVGRCIHTQLRLFTYVYTGT